MNINAKYHKCKCCFSLWKNKKDARKCCYKKKIYLKLLKFPHHSRRSSRIRRRKHIENKNRYSMSIYDKLDVKEFVKEDKHKKDNEKGLNYIYEKLANISNEDLYVNHTVNKK